MPLGTINHGYPIKYHKLGFLFSIVTFWRLTSMSDCSEPLRLTKIAVKGADLRGNLWEHFCFLPVRSWELSGWMASMTSMTPMTIVQALQFWSSISVRALLINTFISMGIQYFSGTIKVHGLSFPRRFSLQPLPEDHRERLRLIFSVELLWGPIRLTQWC